MQCTVDTILKRLKTGKSCDPQNLVNEIFKPGIIVLDLKVSMLAFCNKIKKVLDFPQLMDFLNNILVYKGKGDNMDIERERGICITNVFRSIIMKR